jgi:hypothetical protein
MIHGLALLSVPPAQVLVPRALEGTLTDRVTADACADVAACNYYASANEVSLSALNVTRSGPAAPIAP